MLYLHKNNRGTDEHSEGRKPKLRRAAASKLYLLDFFVHYCEINIKFGSHTTKSSGLSTKIITFGTIVGIYGRYRNYWISLFLDAPFKRGGGSVKEYYTKNINNKADIFNKFIHLRPFPSLFKKRIFNNIWISSLWLRSGSSNH